MVSIEVIIVLAMAAFDLTVVPGRKRLNTLVLNAELFKRDFKKSLLVGAL